MCLISDGNRYIDTQEIYKTFTKVTPPLGSSGIAVQVRVLSPAPRETTAFVRKLSFLHYSLFSKAVVSEKN